MRKYTLFIFLLYTFVLQASIPTYTPERMDSVLNVLDKTIENKALYTEQKKLFLNELRLKAIQTTRGDMSFFVYEQLFQELKNFQMDSALLVANERRKIAEELNSGLYKFYADLNIAEVMIVTGMYKEALDILDSHHRSLMSEVEQYQVLYHLYHSLYILMAEYSFLEQEKEKYYEKVILYKDSILSVLPPEHIGYQLVGLSKKVSEKKYDEAIAMANDIYEKSSDNHTLAMLMHNLSDVYKQENNIEELQFALAISAINDLQSGVKEYMSLPELASILFAGGDVDRSYNYMKCSLDDAIFCKARLRTLQLSQTLPIINASYEAKTTQERNRLVFVVCITVFLLFVLLFGIVYLYKKLKELANTRRSLRNINKELFEVNNNLNNLNTELSESNKLKEEYIGYVFSICSLYIDKLDNFRKKVNRQIKGGLTEELYKQTSTSSLVNDELKEFYKSFDSVFLNLFPDFIEDFNSLLMDGEQVSPKDGELLSPELRIYALVRLGINDSVKIASFLHYSPQTVYNYRLKMRNKARLADKTDFPKAVQALGKSEK